MILEDIQSLTPGNLITLYEIDCRALGGDVERYHAHNDGIITWQGNPYHPWPIKAENFERTGSGQQPNPTLSVGNAGEINGEVVTGIVSALCYALDDLRGATLTRKRTFAKYLDAVNFIENQRIIDTKPVMMREVTPTRLRGDVQGITAVKRVEVTDSLGVHSLTTRERHNLLRRSESVDSQLWSTVRSLLIPNFGPDPSGGGASVRFEQTTTGWAYVFSNSSTQYVQGIRYTASVYVKRDQNFSGPAIAVINFLLHLNAFGANKGVKINLKTWNAAPYGSDTDYGLEHVHGDWYRVWVSAVATTTISTFAPLVSILDTRNGDGYEFWGCQLEEGSAPTKYIPTTGGVRYVADYSIDGNKIILGDDPWPNSVISYDINADVQLGNPTADPAEHFPDERWIISQKQSETREIVTFVLSSPLQIGDQQLPSREIIANVCGWLVKAAPNGGYRGAWCGYTGSHMFDINGNPVTDPAQDKCGGCVSDCKKRFGESAVLNYGGFPSSDRVN